MDKKKIICNHCGSINLKLEQTEEDKTNNRVRLICADCHCFVKWCPKDERYLYEAKTASAVIYIKTDMKEIPKGCAECPGTGRCYGFEFMGNGETLGLSYDKRLSNCRLVDLYNDLLKKLLSKLNSHEITQEEYNKIYDAIQIVEKFEEEENK
jgi:hypothetical protein